MWQAAQDLRLIEGPGSALCEQLLELLPGSAEAWFYRWYGRLERWRGGLQQRLIGGRANACFRIGPMSANQEQLLGQLGYRLA